MYLIRPCLLFAFVLICPFVVYAQEIVADALPVVPDVSTFYDAIVNKNWPIVVALGMTIVVWVIRYVAKDKIPSSIIPYVLIGCTVLSGASARIIYAVTNNQTWWHGMIQGLLEGAMVGWMSMGIYSTGIKKLPLPPKE